MACRFQYTRLFLVLLLAIVVGGCAAKTSYRFLDWIVAWTVDDYVVLDKELESEFERRLDQRLQWHQATQLPRYSALLRSLQDDLQRPLTPVVVNQYLLRVNGFWLDIIAQITPDITAILSQLSDAEVAILLDNFGDKIAESEEKYTDADAKQLSRERIKRVEKTVKRFIGRLNENQRQIIRHWEQQLQDAWPGWLAARKTWRENLATTLSSRREADFEQNITTLFTAEPAANDETYQQVVVANTHKSIELIIALQASLTEKQRAHLNKELAYWAEAFDELASEIKSREAIPQNSGIL